MSKKLKTHHQNFVFYLALRDLFDWGSKAVRVSGYFDSEEEAQHAARAYRLENNIDKNSLSRLDVVAQAKDDLPSSLCMSCDSQLVEISNQTLKDIKALKPNISTLSAKAIKGWWKICPLCDAYALGIEFEEGFPVRTQDGRIINFQELVPELDFYS